MKEELRNLLLRESQNTNILVDRVTSMLKEAPPGALSVYKHNSNYQFYQIRSDGRSYIPKKKPELAIKLAQKEYDAAVLKAAEDVRNQINMLDKVIQESDYEKIIDRFPDAKRKLIKPHFITDEQYIEQWKSVSFETKMIDESVPELFSNNGERVRSKSEKIIADKLADMGILYRYEAPLFLAGYGNVYPDFTMLKLITREDIYWEHFGMMDDAVYSDKATSKINCYIRNGYIPGKNLLLTFESRNCPINMRNVEAQLRAILEL